MSIPSRAERRLVVGAVVGLAAASVVVVALGPDEGTPVGPGTAASDRATAVPTTSPAPRLRSTDAAEGSTGSAPRSPGVPDAATSPPDAGPLPGGTTDQAPSGPRSSTRPRPSRSTDGPGPGHSTAPPAPLVTELPEPTAVGSDLVPGFPAVLEPPAGSQVEASGLSNNGTQAQVSLVAHTSASPPAVLSHYRERLSSVGFVESETSAESGTSAASFSRGEETVVVTVTGDQFVLFASVTPPPATPESDVRPAPEVTPDAVAQRPVDPAAADTPSTRGVEQEVPVAVPPPAPAPLTAPVERSAAVDPAPPTEPTSAD